MAKKSAASMKPAQKFVSEERTPEEYFNEAKAGLLAIVDAYIKHATRPDKVLEDVATAQQFNYEEPACLGWCMAKERLDVYNKCKEIMSKLELDYLVNENWVDPFEDFIVYIDEDNKQLSSMLLNYAKFEAVRMFGEKVESLRFTLLEKMNKEK